MAIIQLEGPMRKDQEYIDGEGKKWVTSSRIADIWNERTNYKGHYTRWSVYQRKEQLTRISTPLGDLYLESEAWNHPALRPHPARPDVAQANRNRAKKDEEN